MKNFIDAATINGTRITNDGYLVADVRCARAGIQVYAGFELGFNDKEKINVYRPEHEVFSADSLKSYAHKPVTIGHPVTPVNAENWKDFASGDIGGEVMRDGDFVRVPIKLMDAAAIKSIEAGTRELSMGYTAQLEFVDGVTSKGEPYDAIMKDIRINHLAIVNRGRAGSECRVGDANHYQWGAAPQQKETLMTTKIVVDGVTLASLEDAAAVVSTLQAKLKDVEAKLPDLQSAHKTEVDAKDGEIAVLKAQIAASDASLEARINERIEAVDKALEIAGRDFAHKGKTTAQIRREVVALKLGDEAVKDREDAYISAAFDTLAKTIVPHDPLRAALGDLKRTETLADARNHYTSNLEAAWKK